VSRVLLTGATGFVGAHAVAPLLDAGHEVHAVARCTGSAEGVHWHAGDLLDARATTTLVSRVRPHMLLHLAWYAEHGRFWTAPENLDWVAATLRLLRAFRETGGARAVLAGSCAEYRWGAPTLSETATPLEPATLYGTAKHGTRIVAESYALGSGLELAWGRMFFLYGPGEHPDRLLPSVARALLDGREAAATDGGQVRDFLHVADAARAFVSLLDSPVTGAVNVASGEPVEVRELIKLAARAAGRPDLVRLGAVPRRPGDPDALLAETRRLREEVGFAPSVELAVGVGETVQWWRGHRSRADA
jgi:nucleoside-diphosphate-sugar epimerase